MSDKPLAQKLLIREGQRVLLLNRSDDVVLEGIPGGVTVVTEAGAPVDVIQVFVANRKALEQELPRLKPLLGPKTILWVTYYKGTAKVKTDINRDTINAYAGTLGLQGVAMISIDDAWAGLRLRPL